MQSDARCITPRSLVILEGMGHKHRVWTRDEEEQLAELVKTKTWAELAEALGCNVDAARKKVRKLGLKKASLQRSEHYREMVIFHSSEKIGVTKTARHFNLSVAFVEETIERVAMRRELHKRELSDPDSFRKFKGRCLTVFKSRAAHISPDPDDFISWAVVKRLEGAKGMIKHLLYEYLNNSRRVHEREHLEFDDGILAKAGDDLSGNGLIIVANELKLTERQRITFLLYYRSQMPMLEISHFLNISQSAAWKEIETVHELLERSVEAKEMLQG